MCNIKLAAAVGEWQRYIAKLKAIEEEEAQRDARIRQIMTSASARIVNGQVRLSSVAVLRSALKHPRRSRHSCSSASPAGNARRSPFTRQRPTTKRPNVTCVTSSTAQSAG